MDRLFSTHRKGAAMAVLIAAFLVLAAPTFSAGLHQEHSNFAPPYPPSSVIQEIVFDWASHLQLAPGSDNWTVTWADDDHQYTTWGDGGGFGGTNSAGRVSLGVGRVEGPRDNYRGYNVWGGKNAEHPAQFGGKSYGIIAVEGVLYMWVSPGSCIDNYNEARLARSMDHGATWTQADWAFTKEEDLIIPTFLQFGKNYAGARDRYIYSYFIDYAPVGGGCRIQKPGKIYLNRAPQDQIMNQAAHEFFAGLDGQGKPRWTTSTNVTDRTPVFENGAGVGWTLSVSYNAGLGRYLLATEHTVSLAGNLSLFDAPEPWGPWTTVAYYTNWGDLDNNFFWNFSNKWLSEDGRAFTLIFTGAKAYDAWNSVNGSFILFGDTPTPTLQPTVPPGALARTVYLPFVSR